MIEFSVEPDVLPFDRTRVEFPFVQQDKRVTFTVGDSVPMGDASIELGFFVPGIQGELTVTAKGVTDAGCVVAEGERKVGIESGKIVNTQIKLRAVRPPVCQPPSDGGPEVTPEGGADVPDGGGADADGGGAADAEAGVEAGPPDAQPDGGQPDADSGAPDTAPDTAADAAPDTAPDLVPDVMPEAIPEAPTDRPPDGRTFRTCEEYCPVLSAMCSSNFEVQASGRCLDLCHLFFPTPPADLPSSIPDQLQCRLSNLVPSNPPGIRCTGGGFNGGGLCGLGDPTHNICDVYCQFAATVCDRFGMLDVECSSACMPLMRNSAPTATSGDNLGCRIRQLLIAGTLAPGERASNCAAAEPEPTSGPCQP